MLKKNDKHTINNVDFLHIREINANSVRSIWYWYSWYKWFMGNKCIVHFMFFYLTRNCKPVTLHICQDCFKKDMELNKDYIYIQYTHDC